MHDGRFSTLEEVIDHYSQGLVYSETVSPLLKNIAQGGVQLTPEEKTDLKAFLLSLTDDSFTTDSKYQPN
jgi:cytochrome c peroxidase